MISCWVNTIGFMNIRHIIAFGKYLSWISVVFVPILWISVSYLEGLYMDMFWFTVYTWFYIIGWYSVVLVMAVRPLADIFPKYKILRQLCLLRRSFGILSAMIIVTLLFDIWIWNPSSFLGFFSPINWYWWDPLTARLSEATAIILLVTSNNFSQKKLGKNWKRIQRLSYIYFITGGLLAMRYGDDYGVMVSMTFVIVVFLFAFFLRFWKKYKK